MTDDENQQIADRLLVVAKEIGYGQIPAYQSNECFTSGAFDLIVFNSGDTARNFQLLSELCSKYGQIKSDERFLKGYFYLLNQLSYATRTTEKPLGMKLILDENPDDTEELQEWYRERH